MIRTRNQASPEAEQDLALQAQARALDTRTPASELYWEREVQAWQADQPQRTQQRQQARTDAKVLLDCATKVQAWLGADCDPQAIPRVAIAGLAIVVKEVAVAALNDKETP